jgi:hypothetical protein
MEVTQRKLEEVLLEVKAARGWLPAPEFRDDLDRETKSMVIHCEKRLDKAIDLLRSELPEGL